MPSRARRDRGRETEGAVAGFLRDNGFPFAERVGSGAPGADITGTPGVGFEVKARRELNLPAWLRQADQYDGLAVVIHRPDGFGVEKVGLWPMTLRLKDGAELLIDAGYGERDCRL